MFIHVIVLSLLFRFRNQGFISQSSSVSWPTSRYLIFFTVPFSVARFTTTLFYSHFRYVWLARFLLLLIRFNFTDTILYPVLYQRCVYEVWFRLFGVYNLKVQKYIIYKYRFLKRLIASCFENFSTVNQVGTWGSTLRSLALETNKTTRGSLADDIKVCQCWCLAKVLILIGYHFEPSDIWTMNDMPLLFSAPPPIPWSINPVGAVRVIPDSFFLSWFFHK